MACVRKEEGETPRGCGRGLAGGIGQRWAVAPCGHPAGLPAGTLALLGFAMTTD